MAYSTFVQSAPCKDADPWLFDQYQLDLAQQGLQYCRGCPYWQDCDSLVKPESSYYDGIAAGKVWRNGKLLARLDSASPHRLVVGEERNFIDVNALEFRGSKLLGN